MVRRGLAFLLVMAGWAGCERESHPTSRSQPASQGRGARPDDGDRPAPATQPLASAPAGSPNVVLISIDSLRADHLHCYGYARATSPQIDQLAAEGVLFSTAISSTSWTLPAHAAMLTGLSDSVHGCTDTDRRLDDSRTTLAEHLQARGYATAGFFAGPYLHPVFGLAQGFETYVDCTSYAEANEREARIQGTIEGEEVWRRSQHDVTNPRVYERVRGWLDRRDERPFFLFLHLWDVHFDFIPPPPFDTMFDPGYSGTHDGRDFFFNPAVNAQMPARDLAHLIALYDGEIAWTDEHVGMILGDLDRLGLTDATLIVVTSDHGTAFFEHGQKAHRNGLWDELIHVPLILRFPGRLPAGLRVAQQVRTIDIVPTVLALVGAPPVGNLMGRSVLPLMSPATEAQYDTRVPAVSELNTLGYELTSFRRAEFKVIFDARSDRGYVFDLLADPGETSSLTDKMTPLVQRALSETRAARRWLKAFAELHPYAGLPPQLPEGLRRQLEGFGYLSVPASQNEDESP